MATTPNSVYYPVLSDAPNGPSQMQQLAQSIDHKIIGNFASAAARTAALTAPNTGDLTYRVDGDVFEYWNGAAWVLQNSPYYEELSFSGLVTGSGTPYGANNKTATNKLIGVTAFSGATWTCPKDGLYALALHAPGLGGGTTSTFARITIGGVMAASTGAAVASVGNHTNSTAHAQRWITATTTATISILQTSGGNVTLGAGDLLSVARLG